MTCKIKLLAPEVVQPPQQSNPSILLKSPLEPINSNEEVPQTTVEPFVIDRIELTFRD
jgi:hypothetical protein